MDPIHTSRIKEHNTLSSPPFEKGGREGNAVDTAVHTGREQIPPTPLFQRGVGGIYCRNDGGTLNLTALPPAPPLRQAQDRLFQRGVTECLTGEARR